MRNFDLSGEIARRRQALEAATAREERERQAARERVRAAAEEALLARIADMLPDSLRAAFGPLRIYWQGNAPYAVFELDGVPYRLEANGASLTVWGYGSGKAVLGADPGEDLLAFLAQYHPDAVYQAQLVAAAEERQRQAQAAQAAAEAEHARCLARIDAARAAAGAWPWPAGRELTLYRWQWATSPATSEHSADYDWAWSAQGRLDAEGWLTTGSGRRLNLGMLRPGPVVEAYTFSGVDALPAELCRTRSISVPGVAYSSNYDAAGGRLLCEAEGQTLRTDCGVEPLPWVQTLLHT